VTAKKAILLTGLLAGAVYSGGAAGRFVFRTDPGVPVDSLATHRDWARAGAGVGATHAGLSMTADPPIRPLRSGRLGKLAESEGYHLFLHRCGSCHMPPDPAMHEPAEWRGVVRRMRDWMSAVGVMPMSAPDTVALIDFLERAATPR